MIKCFTRHLSLYKEGIYMEESNNNQTVLEENLANEAVQESETVKEETNVNGTEVKTEKKKSNTTVIVLAIVCLALLGYLIFTKVGTAKTFKLSTLYPTYFGEVDGEVTLPKNWKYSDQGQLYKMEGDKATLVGQIYGVQLSEEEYTSQIEAFSDYYEMNELEGKDAKVNYFHADQDGTIYDVYFFHKDSTFVQIAMVNASEAEVNTVVNSLSY